MIRATAGAAKQMAKQVKTTAVFANKRTKKYHGATKGNQCRFAEIAPHNRERFKFRENAETLGYVACKVAGCVVK